jgi:hypothetical protein
MKTLTHVCSSMGDIYCDQNGVVKEIIGAYEPTEGEEPNYILNIEQFNFTECNAWWKLKSTHLGKWVDMDAFDILDLSGVNKDGSTFSADHQWREDELQRSTIA